MESEAPSPNPKSSSSFRNWISLAGGLLAVASLFAFLLLLAIDFFAGDDSPYLGIVTYLIAPGFVFLGAMIALLGFAIQRWRTRGGKTALPQVLSIDLTRPRHQRVLGGFIAGSMVLLLVSAVASYQSYHVTKSVRFCGEACHTIMEPQYVAYGHSPHAQVECTACHVGPAASSFVKSKFNGLHQLFVTLLGRVEGPIIPHGTIHIDQRTCEQCHWPQRYVGNVDRLFDRFLDDEENTPFSMRMILKVGGGDPTHGPVGGIHWHMNVANKIEYIALDPALQKIPWVRLTEPDGTVTEYRTRGFTEDPKNYRLHVMDCRDCHNRPAHNFRAPNDAVDLAMALGNISTELPFIKRVAVTALVAPYPSREEGMASIASALREEYGEHPDLEPAISEVQAIYRRNFFPAMNTDWRVYPNNIGHKDWQGCFRCHGGEHFSQNGRAIEKDCNACHLIIAQGSGAELDQWHSRGLPFRHPEEGWEEMHCTDCHNGSME
jgi:hypothetical protein